MKVYGGDMVCAGDVIGRVKRTRVTFNVGEEGSETTYLLACPAWASGGEVWVNELEVTAVIEHGPHDYLPSRKGEGKRGYCRRCGTAKRDHDQSTRPSRPGESWGSPLDDLFTERSDLPRDEEGNPTFF